MKPYKYVQTYRDKDGKVRHYFRRRGMKNISLPERMDTAQFERAYKAALALSPEAAQHKALVQRERAETASLRKQEPRTGVYLLMLAGEIVYVGSSRNMAKRIANHRTNGRPFDKAFLIATREGERLPLEKLLIRKIRPRQNRLVSEQSVKPRICLTDCLSDF